MLLTVGERYGFWKRSLRWRVAENFSTKLSRPGRGSDCKISAPMASGIETLAAVLAQEHPWHALISSRQPTNPVKRVIDTITVARCKKREELSAVA